MAEKEILETLKSMFVSKDFFDYLNKNKNKEDEIVKILFKEIKKTCWIVKEIIFSAFRNNQESIDFIKKYKNYFYKIDYHIIFSINCLRTKIVTINTIVETIINILPNIIEKSNLIDSAWNEGNIIFVSNLIPVNSSNAKQIILKILNNHYNEFIKELLTSFEEGLFIKKLFEILNLLEDEKDILDKIVFDIIKKEITNSKSEFVIFFNKYKPNNIKDYIALIDKNAKNINILIRIIDLLLESSDDNKSLNKKLQNLDDDIKVELVKAIFLTKLINKINKLEDFICHVCSINYNEIKEFMDSNYITSPFSCCSNIIDIFDI